MASPIDAKDLGTLVRMKPLPPTQLPAHPALASLQTAGAPHELADFVLSALEEGRNFMVHYLPAHFRVKDANKHAPPSTAPVELLHHEISAHDLPEQGRTMGRSETWFARTSVHENAAKAGTASWEEFDGGLREDHSLHEKDYTPGIIDARKVLDWNEQLRALDSAVLGDYTDVDMNLMEMVHHVPFPLNTRVFSVLVISAKRGSKEFIDVQIPIDVSKVEDIKYANHYKYTLGVYCSVERGELLENDTKVKWQMATASDAQGAVPMFLQKLGVPGAVVKDVGLFVEWAEKTRKAKK